MAFDEVIEGIDQQIIKLQGARFLLTGSVLETSQYEANLNRQWTRSQPALAAGDPQSLTLQEEKDEEKRLTRRREEKRKSRAKKKAAKLAAQNPSPSAAIEATEKRKGPNPNHPLTGKPKPRAQVEKTLETKRRIAAEKAAAAAPPAIAPAPTPAPAKTAAKKATKTKG